ncbi:Leucine-rich repeat and fibronectin type-III domain-containing protein 6 [Myotis brandtii]|uniref:Leucine-rich repeat and fibronectin type-III domain-containing protein 6 n=1 Tax=Myotis brandtii TaxID=109478 RepID=S7NLK4_MYOBR|nr:Leucine-rich repeat and fibronectin type-III domain-containing protein 6 [Myotis brandtii]
MHTPAAEPPLSASRASVSQNQPPYEAIPQHINSTVVDLRLNENRIHGVQQAALSRFGNLTYLNLTKNEIAYIEDGAFAGQFNLQHRHSFPALYYEEGTDSLSQRVSFLKPLARSKRDSAYAQLSPRHYYSGYSSSPEYSSESTHKIWERFRPYKKHPREEVYMAAGHALRKKVQFAKDEDLHDILDYWKGVSAQHKS